MSPRSLFHYSLSSLFSKQKPVSFEDYDKNCKYFIPSNSFLVTFIYIFYQSSQMHVGDSEDYLL
jgi:hypothetical protein